MATKAHASAAAEPIALAAVPAAGINRFVYVAVAIAALGGLLFGYDTGVISGAILFVKGDFPLSSGMEELVVSAVLIGAVFGAGTGGALTGRFGRRRMIIVAGVVFTLSAIATAFAPTVGWLIAARVASGVGIGIASFISPMYIAELVPAKVRGSLVAVNMLAITTGIVVAYLVDYAFSASHEWRTHVRPRRSAFHRSRDRHVLAARQPALAHKQVEDHPGATGSAACADDFGRQCGDR